MIASKLTANNKCKSAGLDMTNAPQPKCATAHKV